MPRAAIDYGNSGASVAARVLLALACPVVAALTVVATYLHKEVFIGTLWMVVALGGVLLVRPIVGIAAMSGVYLLTAYPTILQDLGFLTVNNLLGLCLGFLLLAHVIETRNLSFVKNRQVLLLALIGVIFSIGLIHADSVFPLMRASRGRQFILDRTGDMSHDFITRLVFLVFIIAFVRTGRDIRILFLTYMLFLFVAVPSALLNWWQGNLNRGFRAVSSVTMGSNANRLAMICLMEVACWWFWSRARPGLVRRAIGLGAVGSAVLVLLVTGSRSGLLGAAMLGVLLQTGPRAFRVSRVRLVALLFVGMLLVATIVPQEAFQRMTTLSPEKGQVGATSNMMREETIELAGRMFREHPGLGVGLGNFREVSRQIYNDQFFRPPHNSYLWAAAEGGVFVVVLYGFFFLCSWQDVLAIGRLAHRDEEIAHVAAAIRVAFLLLCFFSMFADLWLNPIMYMLIGQIVAMRRHLESLPEPRERTVTTLRGHLAA
jgi:O-antigen ligase